MGKGQGTVTAKGFVLLLLVGNIVIFRWEIPNIPFSQKLGILEERRRCGKKMLVKKGIKMVSEGKMGCCRQEKAEVKEQEEEISVSCSGGYSGRHI